jgi:hypothetical protein
MAWARAGGRWFSRCLGGLAYVGGAREWVSEGAVSGGEIGRGCVVSVLIPVSEDSPRVGAAWRQACTLIPHAWLEALHATMHDNALPMAGLQCRCKMHARCGGRGGAGCVLVPLVCGGQRVCKGWLQKLIEFLCVLQIVYGQRGIVVCNSSGWVRTVKGKQNG